MFALGSVDAETLAAYFHPLLPETWDDPVLGPIFRRLPPARDVFLDIGI
ncbi:MAG TPA: hypothetical protein PK156_05795 [Polyangium sp.]|nr:hypothetical protein [Polyangium sp.]